MVAAAPAGRVAVGMQGCMNCQMLHRQKRCSDASSACYLTAAGSDSLAECPGRNSAAAGRAAAAVAVGMLAARHQGMMLAAVVGKVLGRVGCRVLLPTRMLAGDLERKAAAGPADQLSGAACWDMAVVMAAGVHAGTNVQGSQSSGEQ
jgi:hypothetical protein